MPFEEKRRNSYPLFTDGPDRSYLFFQAIDGIGLGTGGRSAVLSLLFSSAVLAGSLAGQVVPDAGQVMREVEEAGRMAEVEPVSPEALAAQGDANGDVAPSNEVTVRIDTIRLSGNRLLGEAELASVVDEFRGRELTFRELQELTRRIREVYMEAGYLARVVLPEQELEGGLMLVEVEEMRFGGVSVSGAESVGVPLRLIEGTSRNGQTEGEPLRYDLLKRSVGLLNRIPGMRSELVLDRGAQPLTMQVLVPVRAERPVSGTVSLDNFGSESTGVVRVLGRVTLANPLKRADALTGVVLGSEGNRYVGVDYSIALGYNGWRVGGHASALDYELVGNFEYLEATGQSVVAGLHATYPIRLLAGESLLFTARTEARAYYNEVAGIEVSDKLLNVVEAGLSWIKRDTLWGGGHNFLQAKVRLGDVDLSGNADNERQDAQDAQTAGTFVKVELVASRTQRLWAGFEGQVSLSGQHGFDNLDSSETVSLGGPNAVRAYPALEGNVDSGLTASIEVSRPLTDSLQASLFYDAANGTLHPTARRGKDSTFLHGAGASLRLLSEAGHGAQISVARRIGDNPNADATTGNDQDGTLREWRVWVSGSFQF